MIVFSCPHCARTLRVEERYALQRGRCKYCNNEVYVPEKAAENPPPRPRPATPPPLPPRAINRPSPVQASQPAGFYRAAPKIASVPRTLDSLYWVLLVICFPVAFVYATTLPAGHPKKKMALMIPVFLVIGGAALAVTGLALSLATEDTAVAAISPPSATAPPPALEDKVYVTPETGLYHRTQCGGVPAGAPQFPKQDAVKAGYQPCPVCEPGTAGPSNPVAPLPPAPAPVFGPTPSTPSPAAPRTPAPAPTPPRPRSSGRQADPNAPLNARTLSNSAWEFETQEGTAQVQLLPGGQAAIVMPQLGSLPGTWWVNGQQVIIQTEVNRQAYTLTGEISGNTLTINGTPAQRAAQ